METSINANKYKENPGHRWGNRCKSTQIDVDSWKGME